MVVGLLQASNVNLLHFHHGLHHASRFVGVRVREHGYEHPRHDLPRDPELVFQPGALAFRAAFREARPQLVHFCLVGTQSTLSEIASVK